VATGTGGERAANGANGDERGEIGAAAPAGDGGPAGRVAASALRRGATMRCVVGCPAAPEDSRTRRRASRHAAVARPPKAETGRSRIRDRCGRSGTDPALTLARAAQRRDVFDRSRIVSTRITARIESNARSRNRRKM
jgi:hypothetical protein